MSKRTKLLLLLLLALALLIAIYTWLSLSTSSSLPRSSGVTVTVTVTPTGFARQQPKEVTKEVTLYYADPASNFEITYLPEFKKHQIFITGSPFATYRQQAEQIFLRQLRLTPEQACQLKVEVVTPQFANPAEAGQEYPLSFCKKNIQ